MRAIVLLAIPIRIPMKTRTAACLVASFLLGLALRADPIGVQADIQGVVHYPNHGPDSVANETQVGFGDHSGFLAGDATATSGVNVTRSGIDGLGEDPSYPGTSGTTTVVGSSTATLGHLQASGTVTASSHGNGTSVVFPHGDAQLNVGGPPVAHFRDTTFVYNSNYALGAAIPVEITYFLDWTGGFDLSPYGYTFGESGATGFVGVDFVGNVSAYDLKRSDLDPALWSYTTPQTLAFTVANGGSFDWQASMTVFAEFQVNALFQGGDGHYPTVEGSAFSNASTDINLGSSYVGTTFTSVTGHVYGGEAPVDVPDSTSTIALLGLGLGGLAFASRQLRRAQVA